MATRYSGNVQIRLTYTGGLDDCYDGKVRADGHSYAVSVYAPKVGFGPGIAYDSPEAYDQAAHSMLSFAANDTDWAEGSDIFTPAAEMDANGSGWAIRRRKAGPVTYPR